MRPGVLAFRESHWAFRCDSSPVCTCVCRVSSALCPLYSALCTPWEMVGQDGFLYSTHKPTTPHVQTSQIAPKTSQIALFHRQARTIMFLSESQ